MDMSTILSLLLAITSMVNCKYNPLQNIDKGCLTNITMSEVNKIKHVLDDNEKVKNLVFTEGFDKSLNYKNNKRCGFLFISNNGTGYIILKFEFFELETSKRCSSYDNVRVYRQGKGQEDWEDITTSRGGYCGKLPPFEVKAHASNMFVEFVADETVTARGFNITYYLTFPDGPPRITCLGKLGDTTCNRNVEALERRGVSLMCKSVASPRAVIEWSKITSSGSQVLRRELVKDTTDEGNLELEGLQLADEGVYKCTAKNKRGSEEETFNLTVIENCRCPKKINIAWYNYAPYTQYLTGFDRKQKPIFKGIMYTILEKMMKDVCGVCSKGHGKSEMVWASVSNRKNTLVDVKQAIQEDQYDIFLPILHLKNNFEYRGKHFLPLFKAPGFAFLVKKETENSRKIFGALWSIAPVLGFTLVMTVLSGAIMWILDAYWNEDEFPRSALKGIASGTWWAYATMTTVGYGDIAPRGYIGRVFAIFCIMGGLVITSILTGAISTALTVASLEPELKLYETKIGTIKHTEENKFAVNRNSDVSSYSTFDDIVTAVNNGDIKGTLVDQYVTGYYTELHKMVKNSIIPQDDMVYGIVLGKRLVDPYIFKDLQRYVETEDFFIQQTVIDNTGEVPKSASFNLMDPSSKMYVMTVLILFGMLVIFTLTGITLDYGYLRPKHRHILEAKNLEMLEDKKVIAKAKTSQKMKDVLMEELKDSCNAMTEKMNNLEQKHALEKYQIHEHIQPNQITYETKAENIEMMEQVGSGTQITEVESSA